MENTKFIKARCKRTGKYFGLEILKIGGSWKVVNAIPLEEEKARLISSEIRQDVFYTNDNLRPCDRCGKRQVGGCSCPPKSYNCSKVNEYNFQCVYCKEMQVDYSAPIVGRGYRDGEVVRLAQGQEVRICSAESPLREIIVGCGWDPVVSGDNMDVDTSVVVAGRNGYEVVYFGDLEHPTKCVVHHGDNLTGRDESGRNDDENITVKLDRVPRDRDRLIFVLNIYKCEERRQKLGNVRNMYIRLFDPDARRTIAEYDVTHNLQHNTALIIGMAYRSGQDWFFRAIGSGSNAKDISELAEEAVRLRY